MDKASLFSQRILVAVADSKKTGVQVLTDPGTAAAVRMLQPYSDIPPDARECIRKAAENVQDRASLLLRAYWATWPIQPFAPACARLLVNPPSGLEPEAMSSHQIVTLIAAGRLHGLEGGYGTQVSAKELQMPMRRALIKSDRLPTGYFDDITVFWDGAQDISFLASYLLPGSTLTLIRPSPELNAEWMEWGAVDLDCRCLVDAIQANYTLIPIYERQETRDRQGGVRVIYGVQAKAK